MARKWATGTIGMSPVAVAGAAVGSTSAGVGDGSEPVGGSVEPEALGAGVAVAIATPPPADGDGPASEQLAARHRQRDGQCQQAEDDERSGPVSRAGL